MQNKVVVLQRARACGFASSLWLCYSYWFLLCDSGSSPCPPPLDKSDLGRKVSHMFCSLQSDVTLGSVKPKPSFLGLCSAAAHSPRDSLPSAQMSTLFLCSTPPPLICTRFCRRQRSNNPHDPHFQLIHLLKFSAGTSEGMPACGLSLS